MHDTEPSSQKISFSEPHFEGGNDFGIEVRVASGWLGKILVIRHSELPTEYRVYSVAGHAFTVNDVKQAKEFFINNAHPILAAKGRNDYVKEGGLIKYEEKSVGKNESALPLYNKEFDGNYQSKTPFPRRIWNEHENPRIERMFK